LALPKYNNKAADLHFKVVKDTSEWRKINAFISIKDQSVEQ
jgi:hypothetical protein